MNENRFFQLLLAVILLIHVSCKCDGRVDCEERGAGYAQIRLVRDGKNAVFGPDAFINQGDIRLYYPVTDYPDIEYYIFFIDSSQSMMLYLTPNSGQILTYPGNSDTLTCTSIVTRMGECCASYELSSVQWNGQNICTDDCGAIMDIEI